MSNKIEVCIEAKCIYCTKCGKENEEGSLFCGYCGNPISVSLEKLEQAKERTKEEIDIAYYKADLMMKKQELEEVKKQTEQQRKQLKLQQKEYKKRMKCPKCGSTSLFSNKKGYSVLKGVAGAAVFGAWGLLAGAIGANKIKVTCIKCGHEFEVKKTKEG